ncbi:uncharacterized protein LOC121726247 [Aricia agestis]|uniref:uncharacterized protein LOC121726247 n=1 Tax=Aricia agestis TaxID=91739 RepID=UPI001C20368C|nr:uncharacterized protein LOC121726247 [Aricia agestis]
MKHVTVAMLGRALVFCGLCYFTLAVRINFTGCQPPWTCDATEITYTCSLVESNAFTVYLKDFYTENAGSVVVQNCRDVRVVLDCSTLQRPSRLQHFKIKDCDRLEFVTLSGITVQTPPEFTIENVREVVSFPRNIFKSAASSTEQKCMGASHFRKLRVVNSKINVINTKAISNVTQVESVEFENVTICDIDSQGIEVAARSNRTVFTITNSKILNLDFMAVGIQSATVKLINNEFEDLRSNAVNITAENLLIRGNKFKEINANCIITSAIKTDVSDNDINLLKTNALAGVKCAKRPGNKEMKFTRNRIAKVEPLSLHFDSNSCKTSTVVYRENRIDCRCRSISFLNSDNYLNDIILDTANNNTCALDACALPVDVVKLLIESDMCHLDLDPRVVCLLYNDKHPNDTNDVTTDSEVTEVPTFYLIRQANTLHDGGAMTAINKDDLLRDSQLNITNRTTVKVVFDPSRDFVETLRSTSGTTKSKAPPKEEYINRCVGSQCKNTVQHDRQKALEFYKYVYAQLRTPRVDVKTKH